MPLLICLQLAFTFPKLRIPVWRDVNVTTGHSRIVVYRYIYKSKTVDQEPAPLTKNAVLM